MKKIKIKIAQLGYIPFPISHKRITKWKSDLFDIDTTVDQYTFQMDSDIEFSGYSDHTLEKELPVQTNFDFLITITNVPLQDDFYARRLSHNRIVISLREVSDILRKENINFENYIIRNIYRYLFVYLMYGNRIPLMSEKTNFTHDDTRGCIFDFNSNKSELIYSLDKPHICPECKNKMNGKAHEKVPEYIVVKAEKEIKKIKKDVYIKLMDFVKQNPLLSIIITFLTGIFMSLLSSFLYDILKIYLLKF
ncbi:hypothetical protein [Plebeiibacterium sediminum]|uniref:Uncharacterized protein n=1 Tax=Plebeiibacterium sediminum TaxID=2992112 RepID=A0AAE3M637_9BACT|nr:hypothetical protein [Plebeiobacterium sediminum]MCW3787819.1 hypothetical protein [Plebeiobacterium sediminum]